MSTPNYSLDIISHHPQFHGKPLRQYYVDGINTVGAWGDEPFELRFKNNTYSKVQVKLSLDGTDVFTGKVADTSTTDKMWVVNGKDTLSLKAWCESNHGGAAFVFTNVNNSVAANTHGNLSSKGIIAAAVFTESYVAPTITYDPCYYCSGCGCKHSWHYGCVRGWSVPTAAGVWDLTGGVILNNNSTFGGYTSNSIYSCSNNAAGNLGYSPSGSINLYDVAPDGHWSKRLQSTAAVGAGQYTNQHISYVSGLVKPTFSESIRVRYMWYDELVSALKAANVPAPHASGFPGDNNRGHVNLGGVPRVGGSQGCFRRVDVMEYSRV